MKNIKDRLINESGDNRVMLLSTGMLIPAIKSYLIGGGDYSSVEDAMKDDDSWVDGYSVKQSLTGELAKRLGQHSELFHNPDVVWVGTFDEYINFFNRK